MSNLVERALENPESLTNAERVLVKLILVNRTIPAWKQEAKRLREDIEVEKEAILAEKARMAEFSSTIYCGWGGYVESNQELLWELLWEVEDELESMQRLQTLLG